MMIRLLLLAASAAVLAPSVAGADTVVPGKSEIAFTMKQMGVNFDGRFKAWKADIVFEPAALDKSKAVVDIDLASLDLASTDSEDEARGPLWFNTAKFPVAHFASTSFRSVGGDRYEVAGKLSLKGLTHDVVVPLVVKADGTGNRVAEGTFSLKRLDYAIGEGEWADTGTVADDIRVRVRVVLQGSG
jgi:polyisoprenoid-binding protein YceI